MSEHQSDFYYPAKSQQQPPLQLQYQTQQNPSSQYPVSAISNTPFIPYVGNGYQPLNCRQHETTPVTAADVGMLLTVHKTNYLLIFIGLLLLLSLIVSVVKTVLLAKQYGQTSAEVAHLRNHFLYHHVPVPTAPALATSASGFRPHFSRS